MRINMGHKRGLCGSSKAPFSPARLRNLQGRQALAQCLPATGTAVGGPSGKACWGCGRRFTLPEPEGRPKGPTAPHSHRSMRIH